LAHKTGITISPSGSTGSHWLFPGLAEESSMPVLPLTTRRCVSCGARIAPVTVLVGAAVQKQGSGCTFLELRSDPCFDPVFVLMWAQCGPGDTPAPVITILREGEDWAMARTRNPLLG